MLLTIIEFAGVTLGVKLLLGAILIYCLFPADGRCAACDGDTVPLQARRGLRALGCACRLERRWCLQCGETMLARRVRARGRRWAAEDVAPVRKAAERSRKLPNDVAGCPRSRPDGRDQAAARTRPNDVG